MNSNQGIHFTSSKYTQLFEQASSRISMDHRGRAYDNIFIKRFRRSLKYEDIYLKDYSYPRQALDTLLILKPAINKESKGYQSDVTYGTALKTLAVDLYSEGNVSLSRIKVLISFLSNQAVSISEESIYGFLNRFVSLGNLSLKQIETTLLQAKALCTDATFVSTNGVQSYIRSLGTDESVRYYAMDCKTIKAMKLPDILNVF